MFFCSRVPTHLWRRLEWMDETGGSIGDICSDKLNPIKHTLTALSNILFKAPCKSSLASLFYHWELNEVELQHCKNETSQFTISMWLQLDYHLAAQFREWPLLLFRKLYVSELEGRELCQKFCSANMCDLDDQMGKKIRAFHDDGDKLFDDKAFWDSMALAARRVRVCNMHIERMLNQINNSIVSDSAPPHMERVAANGYLTQWLTAHANAGGQDPRKQTASSMLQQGVALERHRKQVSQSSSGGMRANTFLMKSRGIRSLAEASQQLAAMEDHEQREIRRQSKSFRRQSSSELGGSGDRPSGDKMFQLSSSAMPLDEQTFISEAGIEDVDNSSFQSWGPELRARFQERVFQLDQGAIPDRMKFKVSLPCCKLHPGICKSEALSDLYVQAGKQLWEVLYSEDICHTWIRVFRLNHGEVDPTPGESLYYYCGHVRGANPRCCLFAKGPLDDQMAAPHSGLRRSRFQTFDWPQF